MGALYFLFKFVGLVIRQFALPNPFEAMWPEQAEGINLIAGLILVPISYAVTGIWYHRGEDPAVGTVLFNVVYICISLALWGILSLAKVISDNTIASIIIASIILLVAVVISLVIRHIRKKKGTEAKPQE